MQTKVMRVETVNDSWACTLVLNDSCKVTHNMVVIEEIYDLVLNSTLFQEFNHAYCHAIFFCIVIKGQKLFLKRIF